MSSAVNNNGSNFQISSESSDDTEPVPVNTSEMLFVADLYNATGPITENIDLYQTAFAQFIQRSVVELTTKTYPELVNSIKELDQRSNGAVTKMLKDQLNGINGVQQLGGVFTSMSMGVNPDIFSNSDSVTIIKNILNHHILEIVSDNLDEHNLLSDNILAQFISVLYCPKEKLNEMLKQAFTEFTKELGGKDLRVVFSIGRENESGVNLAQDALEHKLKAMVGNDAYNMLVPMLLYLNLVAARDAFDNLEKFTTDNNDPIIIKLAKTARKSEIERYTSQLEVREEGLSKEKFETIRTKEILTTFTYTCYLLANAIDDAQFRSGLGALDYKYVLDSIEKSGMLIRWANDIGGLIRSGTAYIDDAFNYLIAKADGEEILDETNLKKQLLNHLQMLSPSDKKIFYSLIKDLSTNETNQALLISENNNRLTLKSYMESVYSKVLEIVRESDLYHEALSQIPNKELYQILMTFIKYCEELYSEGEDFDSEGAVKVLPRIFENVKAQVFPPPYAYAS